jgi:hypothetical protein
MSQPKSNQTTITQSNTENSNFTMVPPTIKHNKMDNSLSGSMETIATVNLLTTSNT